MASQHFAKPKHIGFIFIAAFLLLSSYSLSAQKKWDGGAADGLWNSAANWDADVLPALTDDVIINNEFVAGNYTVTLPSGAVSITVRSVTITPLTGNTIQLILPSANTAVPAFVATGPGYGLVIDNGGVFKNASGAVAGTPVDVSDSIRINDGGYYIHNTSRVHASNITVLSRVAGTENGTFEFDNPDASTTIALSGRVFGKLVLSSASSPAGVVNYTAAGTNDVVIRSDLEIANGVTLNLNLLDTFFINRDLIQNGGEINLASSSRSLKLAVRRNLNQLAGSLITESGTALPEIILCGNALQQINLQGAIINDISLKLNNTSGATLLNPLSLPYKLQLSNGKLATTSTNLLTLAAGCSIQCDSTLSTSFIDGPLRKEGLSAASHFLFPVGKGITLRWMELKNVTGNFTVEFVKANPITIDPDVGPGIHHISSIEYWTVNADALPTPSGNIELSFDNVNSGGVTDISTLRVAQLKAGVWQNQGNTASTGTAGSAGSVISNALTDFNTFYFTLASSSASQNPLPLKIILFDVRMVKEMALLNWHVLSDADPLYFEIYHSANGKTFNQLSKVNAIKNKMQYDFTHNAFTSPANYYQIKILEKDGTVSFSKIIALNNEQKEIQLLSVSSFDKNKATLLVASAGTKKLHLLITDALGRRIKTVSTIVQEGVQQVSIDITMLPGGIYNVTAFGNKHIFNTIRLVKR